jgi:hypothetical protein
MAQTARVDVENVADKAASNVSEIGKRAADKTSDVALQAVERIEDIVATSTQTAQRAAGATLEVGRTVGRRSAEVAGEVSQAFAELASEQSRHGFETFRALASTVDWNEATRIQGEFLRSSIERALAFNRRYAEMVQTVSFAAISAARDEAGEATAQR